jgi:uncharacterized membrane protein
LYIGYFAALLSIVGFATFGRNPSWLGMFPESLVPSLTWFYGISFRLFGEGQSWLLVGIFTFYLWRKARWSWVVPALVVYGLSLASELAGTVWGWPFGPYSYTTLMGERIMGHVPYVIPASWWMMALPAYALASAMDNPSKTPLERDANQSGWASWKVVWVGAFWLTMWDVSLDPAMSYLTKYWVWKEAGGFYGMPLQNWVGWYLTSVVLMMALRWMRVETWLHQLSFSWLVAFYSLNILIPLGMLLVSAAWPAVLLNVVLFGLGIVLFLPRTNMFRMQVSRMDRLRHRLSSRQF